MRIRSIRPEFWRSEDVAEMDWHTRLIFIGLWSYVDDNGVGRDDVRMIVADLFPLDMDTHGSLREPSLRVQAALNHLCEHGQITRYESSGRKFLHITAWDRHQRINRPSETRYPRPTCGNEGSRTAHARLTEPSVMAQEDLPLGEGEKGRRGEGEKVVKTRPRGRAESIPMDGFDAWWTLYPRKAAKPKAASAWRTAMAKPGTTPDTVTAGLRKHLHAWRGKPKEFIPYPATWLNQERWSDEPDSTVDNPDLPDGWGAPVVVASGDLPDGW